MSNECIPYYADARQITVLAGTGGLAGKKFVTNTGPLAQGLGTAGGVATGIVPAAAGVSVLGVAAQDIPAGLAGGVFNSGTVPVTVGASAVTAGTKVMSDANGNCVPWTTGNQVAGTCMGDTAAGADAPIKILE